jgi:hypothetical protein
LTGKLAGHWIELHVDSAGKLTAWLDGEPIKPEVIFTLENNPQP